MGGANEIVTPKAPVQSGSTGGTVGTGGLRVHESNNGEIHFHDDAKSAKVAIPVSLWHKMGNELITLQREKWEYLDPVNETLFTAEMISSRGGLHDLIQKVEKVRIGETLKMMAAHLKR